MSIHHFHGRNEHQTDNAEASEARVNTDRIPAIRRTQNIMAKTSIGGDELSHDCADNRQAYSKFHSGENRRKN